MKAFPPVKAQTFPSMAWVMSSSSSSLTANLVFHRFPISIPPSPRTLPLSLFSRPLASSSKFVIPNSHKNTIFHPFSSPPPSPLPFFFFSFSSHSFSTSSFSTPPNTSLDYQSLPEEVEEEEDEKDDDFDGELEISLLEEEEEEEEEEVGLEENVGEGKEDLKRSGLKVPTLSVKEKKELASYAHALGKKLKSQLVGKSGVTPSLATSFIETLEANELLKIKIHRTCPGELDEVVQQLEEATGSVVVGRIGRTVIVYRPSLTKLKAEEKKVQARRIFVRKQAKTKLAPLSKDQAPTLSALRRRGRTRTELAC